MFYPKKTIGLLTLGGSASLAISSYTQHVNKISQCPCPNPYRSESFYNKNYALFYSQYFTVKPTQNSYFIMFSRTIPFNTNKVTSNKKHTRVKA